MAPWRSIASRAAASVLFAVAGQGCGGDGGEIAGSEAHWTDRYPRDISPPAGTRYPCALTALPRDLPGVPEGDRRYVNHVYADLLVATRAKLAFLRDVERGPVEAALESYLEEVDAALERLREETPPPGLESFQADVVAALELHRETFEGAVRTGPDSVHRSALAAPEARRASKRLRRAWATMSKRYPEAPRRLRDSVYHHLCALDLY